MQSEPDKLWYRDKSSLARPNSMRSATVACPVRIASSEALSSALMASACSDLNSIHSTDPSLVMKS